MLGRLETALERERRFVADASHELRTPLAMLRTELELALRRQRTPEELERALRSASEETERLSQLAEDLLVLARAQGGSLPVRREQVSARELLEGLRERYGRRARDNGREIDARADECLTLFVDRLRIEQALGNLIDNALRHGGGRMRRRSATRWGGRRAARAGRRSRLPPGFIDHAFDPFSRADDARTGAGAGLGLAIVDVIARAHDGSARAANVEGGADAWIALPAESNVILAGFSACDARVPPMDEARTTRRGSLVKLGGAAAAAVAGWKVVEATDDARGAGPGSRRLRRCFVRPLA